MIKTERVWETCKTCGSRKLIKEEEVCCDGCKKLLPDDDDDKSNDKVLTAKLHYLSHTTYYYFCSWKCYFKIAKTLKSDYFLNMPYLTFDHTGKGSAKEFWKCMNEMRRGKHEHP